MNKLQLVIPHRFIKERTKLTWGEIRYGLSHGYISAKTIIDIAVEKLANESDPQRPLIELAALDKTDDVHPFIDDLVGSNQLDSEYISRKWLYLLLAWIYVEKEKIPKPLEVLAEIYAEFGYPEEIKDLVYYMPGKKGFLKKKSNECELYRKWSIYLKVEKDTFL